MRIRQRVLLFTILIASMALPSGPAAAQVIFIDPCGIEIPPFTIGNMTVWICVEGPIQEGITGAEFRIAGIPANWLISVTPTAPVTITGDLTGSGAIIDTNGCTQGSHPVPGGMYLEVCTIQVTPLADDKDVLLMPASNDPQQPAPFDCPFVTLCDDPVFTKVCCFPHGAYVNPVQFGCALPVQANSWSEIKNLYH